MKSNRFLAWQAGEQIPFDPVDPLGNLQIFGVARATASAAD